MSAAFPAWLMDAAADKMAEYRAVISSLKLDLGERDARITQLEADKAVLTGVLREIAGNNWKDQSRAKHVAREALSRISSRSVDHG